MTINGKLCYLWRAVDHEGEVLETVVTAKRDKAAALKFLKRIMKNTAGRGTSSLAGFPLIPRQRRLIGRHPQRRLTDFSCQPTKIVLRRPPESAQYTSVAFGARCKEAGIRPSTGSVGDAYDNAMCESFVATLECELIDRRRFRSHSEARMALFQFIEGF